MGDQHSLALQGWAVSGMAAPILLGTAFQRVLDPIPSTRTQPGSREPACPIPDSSFTGETLPEHSFAELSFHGIPGGEELTRQPRALTGLLPAGSQRSCVRNQFSKLGSNPPSQSLLKGWECRVGFGVGGHSSDPGTNPFLQSFPAWQGGRQEWERWTAENK